MDILLATDGSYYALEAARFLAARLDPHRVRRLRVVAVAPGGRENGHSGPGPVAGDEVLAQGWLEATLAILRDAGLQAEGDVLAGDPARVLVTAAGEGGHDVVVAGVKGRGAAPFFELGRVATALKQSLRTPVLLVRPAVASPQSAPSLLPLRVLLPAVEGGSDLRDAWGMLQGFRLTPGSVELAVLVEGEGGGAPGRSRWAGGSRAERRLRARQWADGLLPSLALGAGVDPVVSASLLEGRPVREIEGRIRDTGYDLLVLHLAPPDPEGTPDGRVAEELVWFAPCSVLLLPSPAPGVPGARPRRGEGERFAVPPGT
jgi:nucleotide-binding universal stress UspA family protein